MAASSFNPTSLKRYSGRHGITFTQCRPYKKNDQCRNAAGKNGEVPSLRPLVGYARYEGGGA
jgi:hypothetical protein